MERNPDPGHETSYQEVDDGMSISTSRGLKRLALLAAVALGTLACGAQQTSQQQAQTDPGVTKDSILLGGTYPLSGSATAYAAVAVGANAYFQYIDSKGGVNGRKVTYKVVDDGYLPANTPAKAKELVEQDQVFATFGSLGTAPNAAVKQYYNDQKVPQMFVFTGASQWGAQYDQFPFTIGWQPDYVSESKIYAKYILQNMPSAKIAVLYQNDAYGQDYLKGLQQGLGDKASTLIVKTATYNAGDPVNMSSQVTTLKSSGADTFFVVTTPAYSASALTETAKQGWKPHLFINNVGADALTMTKVSTALGGSAALDGAVTAQYLKDPNDPAWANDQGIKLYKDILSKYGDSYGFHCKVEDVFCVAGMGAAYTMVDVLRKAGNNLTRKNVMDIAANQLNETDNPFTLPGIKIATSKTNHFPITQEKLQKWQTDKWIVFGDLVSAR
jgi:branched-chain amino acid transport system substrate-binding protein